LSEELTKKTISKLIVSLILSYLASSVLSSLVAEQVSNSVGMNLHNLKMVIYFLFLIHPLYLITTIIRELRKNYDIFQNIIISTPYDYLFSVYKHSKAGYLSCVLGGISLIPFIILSKRVEVLHRLGRETTIINNAPIALYLALILYILGIFFFYYSRIETGKIVTTPIADLFKQLNKGSINFENFIENNELLNSIAKRIGLEITPKLILTDMQTKWAFGKTERDSIILISKKDFHYSEPDELETILTHELWHLKSDIESRILSEVEKQFIYFYIGYVTLFLGIIISLISLLLATSTISWPFRLYILGVWPQSILGNPVMYIYSAIPHCFCGLVFYILSPTFETEFFKYSYFNLEQEEYFIDAMTLLTTKKLLALVYAILRDDKVSQLDNIKLIKNYYLDSPAFSITLSEFKKIIDPKFIKKGYSITNRVKQAILIDKLLRDHVELKIRRNISNFKLFNIFRFNISIYSSTYARFFNNIEKEKVKELYAYIRNHNKKFNLIECSNTINLGLNDGFIVFACLLLGGVIE
jgi:hypothetical protein